MATATKQEVTHHGRQISPDAPGPAHASLSATMVALRTVSVGHWLLSLLPS